MSSSLQITQQLTSNSMWEVIAQVLTGGTLPLDIFIYTNTGTTSLGEYQGVCDFEQYQRLRTFTGTAIPIFGNKFVKHAGATVVMDLSEDPTQVISVIEADVKALSLAITNAGSTTQIVSIP